VIPNGGTIKKSYLVFILTVLAAFNLLAGSSIFAQEIRVVTEVWEPYNFEKNGRVRGISTEIVESSLKRAGIRISGGKIEIYPWIRSYQAALNSENVLIYTILRTQERENLFKWVGPIIPSERFYFYKIRTRKDISVGSLDQAKKYQIGALRGSVHEDFLKKNKFPEGVIQTVGEQDLNLIKLLKGRIDFIIDTDSSLKIRTRQMNLPFSEFEKSLFLFENDYYMAFSKNTPSNTVQKIRTAFSQLKNEGQIYKIIEQYK
jgi:polar amino acid transport system substrate-binding protein